MDYLKLFDLLKEKRDKRSNLFRYSVINPFYKALQKYFETTDPCDNAFVQGNVRCMYNTASFNLHMENGYLNSNNELVLTLNVELWYEDESSKIDKFGTDKWLVINIPAMLIRYFNQEDFDKWVLSYWTLKHKKEKSQLIKFQKMVDKFPAEAKEEYESLKQQYRKK